MKRALLAPVLEELRDASQSSLWQMALAMLSLDRVRPFWGELGLRFQHQDETIGAFRRFVSAEQEFPGSGQSRTYVQRLCTLTRRLFAELAEVEGEEAALGLWNWFQTAFTDEPKWHWMWRILLYRLHGETALRQGTRREQARRLTELSDRWSDVVRDLEIRIAHLQKKPMAGWDAQLYRDAQRDCAEYDPLDKLEEALERTAFDRLWAEVTQLLGPREMERLIQWGRTTYAEIQEERKQDEEQRRIDEILGDRKLAARDAVVPPEWRVRN